MSCSLEDMFKEFVSSNDGGTEKLREELILEGMSLVNRIVGKYRNRFYKTEREDLVQEGVIGLIRAVDEFDPSRDVQFSTPAHYRILGSIQHYARKNFNLPRTIYEFFPTLLKGVKELSQKLGREPTSEEIAVCLNITTDEVADAYRSIGFASRISLDEIQDDGDGKIRYDIPDPKGMPSALELDVRLAIRRLSEKERIVITLHHFEDKTCEEIARELGCSKQSVNKAIVKAYRHLRKSNLRDYALV